MIFLYCNCDKNDKSEPIQHKKELYLLCEQEQDEATDLTEVRKNYSQLFNELVFFHIHFKGLY